MANDGIGHLIDIPSIFISNEAGEKILNSKAKCGSDAIFKIKFDVYLSPIANVTFWLDSSNRESFVTIRDFFRDYYGVIRKYVNLDLRYEKNYLGIKSTETAEKKSATLMIAFWTRNRNAYLKLPQHKGSLLKESKSFTSI